MADATVQLYPDSTGQKVDVSTLTVGSNTALRQRINIADPSDAFGLSAVAHTRPVGTEYGLFVRQVENAYSLDSSFGASTTHATKGSAGVVYNIYVSNINTILVYFQLHNKTTAPSSGNVPIYSIPVPAGTSTVPTSVRLDASFFGVNGHAFGTGISWGISSANGTFTDAGTAADYNVYIHYI